MVTDAPILQFEILPSTNAHLKALVAGGVEPGTVVIAAQQTAGYGQRGRSWLSPPGAGLYMSVALPLPTPLTLLPLLVGLCAQEAVATLSPEIGLKWVNDLVARGRKLGGVLVEVSHGVAIAGIGLNRLTPPVEGAIGLDELLTDPNTTPLPSPLALARSIRERLAANMADWSKNGPEPWLSRWRAVCVILGKAVVVEDVAGIAEAIGPEGQLLIRTPHGALTPLLSGTLRLADGSYC